MLRCPNCGNKIPFWKPWILTNHNCITCSSCGKKLSANRKINSLIGGIGGGLGAVLILVLFKSNYSFWAFAIIILSLFCVLLVSLVFTKLEIK